MITYWASRFDAAVVLPKCAAALTASTPSWWPVAADGEAVLSSTHTPASALPPVGYATCSVLLAGQVCDPVATPSQYWVATPDHSSPSVPRPLKNSCRSGPSPLVSPDSVTSPLALVLWLPHWEP